jgi:hypothetical protein
MAGALPLYPRDEPRDFTPLEPRPDELLGVPLTLLEPRDLGAGLTAPDDPRERGVAPFTALPEPRLAGARTPTPFEGRVVVRLRTPTVLLLTPRFMPETVVLTRGVPYRPAMSVARVAVRVLLAMDL